MTAKAQRNHALDGLKLLMIIIVVLHHSGYLSGFLRRGYMSVEFFFMASGCMLMRSALAKREMTTGQYVLGRLRKLYPHYVLSFAVYFVYSMIRAGGADGAFLLRGLSEMLLVQNIGITADGGFNYPCWYICVLLFGSAALYWLQKRISKKALCLAGGAVAAAVYGYIFLTNGGNIEVWHTVLVFHLPVWRGIAGLAAGMMIHLAHRKIDYARRCALWQAAEVVSLAAILVLMCLPLQADAPILLCTAVMMLAVGNPASVIGRASDNAFVRLGSRYEYGVFLNHAFAISVLRDGLFRMLGLPGFIACPLLLVMTFAYSALTTRLAGRIGRAFSRCGAAGG